MFVCATLLSGLCPEVELLGLCVSYKLVLVVFQVPELNLPWGKVYSAEYSLEELQDTISEGRSP